MQELVHQFRLIRTLYFFMLDRHSDVVDKYRSKSIY